MKKIRTLIVDDEPLAQEGVKALLVTDPEIELIGTCGDGHSALTAIRAHKPDLVFLDIQMPKRDGFEVLVHLKPAERPRVIFVTAFDEFAVRAFEFCAIDYLLKPFQDSRFLAAVARAKAEIRQAGMDELERRVTQLIDHVRAMGRLPPEPFPPAITAESADRIVVKDGSDHHFVKTADIIWIEAQGDFIKVQTNGQSRLARQRLQDIQGKLDATKFLRIHRSFIANVAHVRHITPALYGDYTVVMSDGSKLRLSRNYRAKLKELIASPPAS